MKGKAIGYWVCTGLIAFAMMSGGAMQVARMKENVEGFARLGYPVYFMVMLGVWKLLGGVAILAPKFPRLKEWAYAGIFIDLSSAAVSNASMSDSMGHVVAPLVCIGILAGSWVLRPPSRILGDLFPSRA
jgi:uncharacterized membrane protein YphA (DoxX/SURF4 family)